jgi:hypothetical protein
MVFGGGRQCKRVEDAVELQGSRGFEARDLRYTCAMENERK